MKDGGERLLIRPAWRGWKRHNDVSSDGKKTRREKADPNRPTRRRVTIDLGKNIAKDVGDGKKKLRSADPERAKGTDLLSDQIGDQEYGDEAAYQDIVMAEGLFRQPTL